MTFFRRSYDRVVRTLPGQLAGRVDSWVPSLRDSWGGPLNGQKHRRRMVREIAGALEFDLVVETGTYRGTSTEFFSSVFGVPVETVEASSRYYWYSARRLRSNDEVAVKLGDSRSFLRALSGREGAAEDTVFVYLDAHWEKDLPLWDELKIIGSAWGRAVVMIDDFEVPGDEGYRFDDYGEGLRLTADLLPSGSLEDWALLYPSVRSNQETGARRGSCVLASPAVKERLIILASLRAAEWPLTSFPSEEQKVGSDHPTGPARI